MVRCEIRKRAGDSAGMFDYATVGDDLITSITPPSIALLGLHLACYATVE
jgi:hypothetical protein